MTLGGENFNSLELPTQSEAMNVIDSEIAQQRIQKSELKLKEERKPILPWLIYLEMMKAEAEESLQTMRQRKSELQQMKAFNNLQDTRKWMRKHGKHDLLVFQDS